jgi:Zn-dependent M16 (insulinase) family peptidase
VENHAFTQLWDLATPKMVVAGKALRTKIPELFKYMALMLTETVFHNQSRLLEIVREIKSAMEMNLMRAGHSIAVLRMSSYFEPHGAISDMTSGLSQYVFLRDLEANFADRATALQEKLAMMVNRLFRPGNMILSLTGEEADLGIARAELALFSSAMPKETLPLLPFQFSENIRNEGLMAPANIQYAAQGYNFRKLGYEFSGKLNVLRSILSKDFLYGQLRVRGGAYGAMCNFSRVGTAYFVSYRDPNLRETYQVYEKLAGFIRQFDCSDRDITKYIIGTIADMDHPLTPSQKGRKAASLFIAGITDNDRQKERSEVLETRQSDIRALAEIVESVIAQDVKCTFGNERKLRENSDLFKELVPVFT